MNTMKLCCCFVLYSTILFYVGRSTTDRLFIIFDTVSTRDNLLIFSKNLDVAMLSPYICTYFRNYTFTAPVVELLT